MLESVSFEFNVRHPLRLVFKILQLEFGLARVPDGGGPDPHARLKTLVTNITVDLNYTFALLKQTTSALAIACVELALRLRSRAAELERVFPPAPAPPEEEGGQGARDGEGQEAYARFQTTRAAVSETLLDLLDLYATHRAATCAGPSFGLDDVTAVRLRLNELDGERRIPRYAAPPRAAAEEGGPRGEPGGEAEGAAYAAVLRRAAAERAAGRRPTPSNPTSPAGEHGEQRTTNGARRNLGVAGGDVEPITPEGGSVITPADMREEGFVPLQEQAPVRRFVLQNEDAVAEERVLAGYFVSREEEYEREEEVEDGWESVEGDEEDERDAESH
jgi:hypothetical protein